MVIAKTIRIAAPPEQLWELLTDVEQLKRWNPSIVSEQPLSGNPGQVGHVSRMQIKEGSSVVEYTSEITAYQPARHLGILLRGGGLGDGPMSVDYVLTPHEADTTLEYEVSWTAHGFMLKLMLPLIMWKGRRNADDALERLNDLAAEHSRSG